MLRKLLMLVHHLLLPRAGRHDRLEALSEAAHPDEKTVIDVDGRSSRRRSTWARAPARTSSPSRPRSGAGTRSSSPRTSTTIKKKLVELREAHDKLKDLLDTPARPRASTTRRSSSDDRPQVAPDARCGSSTRRTSSRTRSRPSTAASTSRCSSPRRRSGRRRRRSARSTPSKDKIIERNDPSEIKATRKKISDLREHLPEPASRSCRTSTSTSRKGWRGRTSRSKEVLELDQLRDDANKAQMAVRRRGQDSAGLPGSYRTAEMVSAADTGSGIIAGGEPVTEDISCRSAPSAMRMSGNQDAACKACGAELGSWRRRRRRASPAARQQYGIIIGVIVVVAALLIFVSSAMGSAKCKECKGKGVTACVVCKGNTPSARSARAAAATPDLLRPAPPAAARAPRQVCYNCKGNWKQRLQVLRTARAASSALLPGPSQARPSPAAAVAVEWIGDAGPEAGQGRRVESRASPLPACSWPSSSPPSSRTTSTRSAPSRSSTRPEVEDVIRMTSSRIEHWADTFGALDSAGASGSQDILHGRAPAGSRATPEQQAALAAGAARTSPAERQREALAAGAARHRRGAQRHRRALALRGQLRRPPQSPSPPTGLRRRQSR